MQTPPRVRLTLSLNKELADQIDQMVDGTKIRNRSHAVELLLGESLQIAQVKEAVILAGGDQAQRRIPAIIAMLKTLRQEGIFSVTMAVGYLGETIRTELRTGEAYGVKIQYIQSELGTGGALAQLRGKFKQSFLVVNIERPVQIDIKNLVHFHREHQPVVTLATKSLLDLSGVYLMEPEVFQYIPEGFCMLEETVFHELTKQGKLLPYPIVTEV